MKAFLRTHGGRRVLVVPGVVLAAGLLLGVGSAFATGTLDQSNPGPATGSETISDAFPAIAQTFTAGVTGSLDQVKLNIDRHIVSEDILGDLIVRIEEVDTLANPGVPDDSNVLATQTVPEASVSLTSAPVPSDVLTVVFDQPAVVDAGTEYALVLTSTRDTSIHDIDNVYEWGLTSTDSYSGGAVCGKSGSWICGSQDAVFATYVTSAPPQIGVSPSSMSFADQIVGSTSGPQTVTISNTASSGSQSLAIGQLTVGGANPGDFALGNDTCSNASVPPGSDCTVDVSFTPGAVGSRSASLSIPSNAAGSPDQVPLSGTGTTQADVALIISGPGSAKRGTQVSFTITVSNAGPSTAHDVVMSYPVPSGAKFAGVTTTQGTCTHPSSGGTVRCSLGDLAKGGSAGSGVSIKITAKVGSTLASIASAYSTTDGAGPATLDPNTSNNWMSLSTTVT